MNGGAALPFRASALLDRWFGTPDDPQRLSARPLWFEPQDWFDDLLRTEFLNDCEQAAAGRLDGWQNRIESSLALVLLLDQIPRNIFRGALRAYATDPLARAVAARALDRGFDHRLPSVWRRFFYLPFEHSEAIEDQRRSLSLFAALPEEDEGRSESLRIARRYVDIIERFGRFPHRNAILGRSSTPAEIAFLNASDPVS